jgi:hypothetical protein
VCLTEELKIKEEMSGVNGEKKASKIHEIIDIKKDFHHFNELFSICTDVLTQLIDIYNNFQYNNLFIDNFIKKYINELKTNYEKVVYDSLNKQLENFENLS